MYIINNVKMLKYEQLVESTAAKQPSLVPVVVAQNKCTGFQLSPRGQTHFIACWTSRR